jgi:Pyridoxamine 5'-phosphate oxidase
LTTPLRAWCCGDQWLRGSPPSRSTDAQASTLFYFVHQGNKIWLGTPDWTLAVRNVKANPQVSVLFESERDTSDQRVLRITGRAEVRTDKQALRSYNLRAALKYLLTPAGIRNSLTHWRQVPLKRYYHAQSAERGGPSVIVITPERFEILSDPTRLPR